MGETDDVRRPGPVPKPDEPMFRRYLDKLFIAAVSGLVTIVAWVGLKISDHVDQIDGTQRQHAERIMRVEEGNKTFSSRLEWIHQQQVETNNKLDKIVEKLNSK